jgi:hypothetical protein
VAPQEKKALQDIVSKGNGHFYDVRTAVELDAALTRVAQGVEGQIININADLYGFSYHTGGRSDPAFQPGDLVDLVSNNNSGVPNQLTFRPGTYRVTNAAGLVGATPGFTGWRFNSGNNWVWNFVIVDDSTKRVVYYGEAGDGIRGTQAEVAGDPAVQKFSGTFKLTAETKLDFGIRDYFLSDNAGGVALEITPLP